MNLYIESLSDYLISKADDVLNQESGDKEARFIVQSLSPSEVFSFFENLEEYRVKKKQTQNIKTYFRVASGLWEDWCKNESSQSLDDQMRQRGAITSDGNRKWIDEEDKLTWYRNRTAKDEQTDALLVVLVGLNHATDQGGLSDFHIVDEKRIWQSMDQCFNPWLDRVNSELDLCASDTELGALESALQQIFSERPMRLNKVAEYLERVVSDNSECSGVSEFKEALFQSLPFWGIPPLLSENSKDLNGSNLKKSIKEADSFISHKKYKTLASQKKDWEKITKALDDNESELFAISEENENYKDLLESFIFKASDDARNKLLQINALPLLKTLRIRERKPGVRSTIPTYSGMSFEAFLHGIWQSFSDFSRAYSKDDIDDLASAHIELIQFQHDLIDNDEEGEGAEEQARQILSGCIGGLDNVFKSIDFRLPEDEDQALLPSNQWERSVPIDLIYDLDEIKYGVSRKRANLRFKVCLLNSDKESILESVFCWRLDSTQPERVRFMCARDVLRKWQKSPNPERLLPSYKISASAMAAIYYAVDEEEANRLVSLALTDLQLVNMLEELSAGQVDPQLWTQLSLLISDYRSWLDTVVHTGYYEAMQNNQVASLIDSYSTFTKAVLDTDKRGGPELLRRVYKAFFLVDELAQANDSYIKSAIAWGLSPCVLELSSAQTRFLADGFPEVLAELLLSENHESDFGKLLDLAKIHRPLAGIAVNQQGLLSAEIHSFGLIHCLGEEPSTANSLAAQALLREDDVDDDDVREVVRPCEERDLVVRVLQDYQKLHPYAQDGLRILAVNVKELQTILSGVDKFLHDYLADNSDEWPAFHCTIMVYSTSSSPLSMEYRLGLWRDHITERHREKGRSVNIKIGHRFTPREQITDVLNQEKRLYDVAFLFNFLTDQLTGKVEVAEPFEFSFGDWSGLQFPIADYPRPINDGNRNHRQSLISNRRLQVQARHADMTARLSYGNNSGNSDHVVYGQVDYQPWAPIVEALHKQAQWIACIDPFVDKRLLVDERGQERRKIVGFSSGLGSYGELNLTLSTEQDSLKQLTDKVEGSLVHLLAHENPDAFGTMAARIVGEAEEIIGLASLRAVVGDGEKIREVVGFAAVQRLLAKPVGQATQLIPLDSMLHWFSGKENGIMPDLLQLSLEFRENDIPLVHAHVIECKFAKYSVAHIHKASEQLHEGLRHLTSIFTPKHSKVKGYGFNRRYWWAQLHRAISSRSVVSLSEQEWGKMDLALEKLAEGDFEIQWQGSICTFWTDQELANATLTNIPMQKATIQPVFDIPTDFYLQHFELGYRGVSELFSDTVEKSASLISSNVPNVSLRPENTQIDFSQPSSFESTDSSETNSISDVEASNHVEEHSSREETCSESKVVVNEKPNKSEQEPDIDDDNLDEQDEIDTPSFEHDCLTEYLLTDRVFSKQSVSTNLVKNTLSVPDKILIGTRKNDQPVYWHYGHKQLANRHLLLFGTSGSGKTYGIQCLLSELAKQHIRSVIIDYTDGFLPNQVEEQFSEFTVPKNHFVVTDKLPLNPFRKQTQIIDPSIPPIEESAYQVATRVASIFASVFMIGDQQFAALRRVLQEGIERSSDFTFEDMLSGLRNDSSNGETLASKLEPLIEAKPFRQEEDSTWDEMIYSPDNLVHTLQLKGLGKEIQKMVTEFALWDLWDYAQSTGSKNRPIPVVLDEIQNLDHSSDSPIDKMLREGRKFGLSMILATQTTSQFTQEQRDRLFQAGHKLFFKPATTEVDRFAQILSQATDISKSDWAKRLSKLEKGQCWSLGPVLKSGGTFKEEAVLVNVTALEQRDTGA
ncbi:type IV secretion system DNA-binding domain-containing protein [Endozoicomonas sp. ISHI1]|uniref:type IV secretion system DNA-binding domain-containing protein n=1 Tax=Endozoicomonas sp. ISHI1 TaxID=2825882 RepID=UPI0021497E42|nr:type IV secretion system DNA-binding domain-containing protein [Endozoicomonas sp. ISHI1]